MKEDLTIDLLFALKAVLEYIDAIPKDIELPAMPGIDRDWVEYLVEKAKEERK